MRQWLECGYCRAYTKTLKMSKVILLSRTFPAYHLHKGQPTYFVEKTCNSLLMAWHPIYTDDTPVSFLKSLSKDYFAPKHHTIRAGKRWKDGEWASLRVWSGKPYRSPQIAIAPDVQLSVVDIEINKLWEIRVDGVKIDAVQEEYLAKNDGLTFVGMVYWFNKSLPFSGQILCWGKNILDSYKVSELSSSIQKDTK